MGNYLPATTVSQSFNVSAVVPGAPIIGTATPANRHGHGDLQRTCLHRRRRH